MRATWSRTHSRVAIRSSCLDRHTVDLLITTGSRTAVGLVSGVVLALGGWFAAWFLFLRPSASLTEAMIVFTLSTGVFGGIGAGLAWLRIDDGVRSNVPVVLLAVAGGAGGALAGLAYAHIVFDVTVTRGEGDITAIAAAGIAANLPPLILFLVTGLRRSAAPRGAPLTLPGRRRIPKSR